MARAARILASFGVTFGLACACVAWLAAAWLSLAAWRRLSIDHALVAVALFVAGIVVGTSVLLIRAAAPLVAAEPDIAVVFDHLHRAERSLRVLRLGRGLLSLICSAVVLFWVVEGFQMVDMMALLIPSTILCFATACFYLPWLASREPGLRAQHAAAQRRLKELKAVQLRPGETRASGG
jgi:hypothetical protein